MEMLKSSTRRLETSINFSEASSLSTLTHFHGCCSVFNVVGMKRMMHTGACLDAVVNTHNILVFAHTAVKIEVNKQVEVTLYNAKSIQISSPGLKLFVSTVLTLNKAFIFTV